MSETVYIAPTGNDTTGDGSSSNPWLTLTKAVAETTVGDTIIAKAGTHAWDTIGDLNGNRILRGETGNRDDVIFDGNGENFTWTISDAFDVGVKETTVKDITFTGLYATDTNRKIMVGSGSITSDCLIENCVFHDIELSGEAANGELFAYGVVPTGNNSRTIFRKCTMYNIREASGAGNSFILLTQTNMGDIRLLFEGCTLYLDGANPINNFARQSTAGSGADIQIEMKNSIFVNATTGNIAWKTNAHATVVYTMNHSNFYASPNSWTNLPTLDANSTTVDPLFISPSSPDRIFELRPGSPIFKTGTKI